MYGFSCGCGLAEHPHPPQTAMQLPALSRQQLLQQPLPPTTASSRSQPRRAGGRRKLLAVHQSARLHTSQLETWKGCACWFPAREHACTAAEGTIAAGCSKRAACAVGRVGSGLASPGTAGLLVAVEASPGPAGLCFMWLCQQFNCHASTISITSSDQTIITSSDQTIGRSDSAWGQGCGCVDE
jgi:hypothetical protein